MWCLLRLHLAVLLDMDMVIRLQNADLIFGELDPVRYQDMPRDREKNPHVKPLINVNSCLISPPSDLALSLALVSSSGEAFSLSVTCVCVNIAWLEGSRWDRHCKEAFLRWKLMKCVCLRVRGVK
jgi:hypothetical protein